MPRSSTGDVHSCRIRHRQALADPATSALLAALRDKWRSLELADRAGAVESLLSRGCTARGLAADLGCSEGAIRRYLRVARLPPAELARIRRGESAKLILQQRASASPVPAKHRALSASVILEQWLSAQKLLPPYRDQFLEELARRVWQAPPQPARQPQPLAALKPRRARPRYGPDVLEYLLAWCLRWMLSFKPADRLSMLCHLRSQFA